MIRQIAKQHLDPFLKSIGFKRTGLAWNRTRGEFVDVITLQTAKHSTSSDQSITGNVAVCVPEFRAVVFGNPPATFIEADCVVNLRFGELLERQHPGRALDRWWDLTAQNVESVGREFRELVETRVVPFLESFTDFHAMERHLQERKGWQNATPLFQINRALIYGKLGDRTKCEEILSSINNWSEKLALVREWVEQRSR